MNYNKAIEYINDLGRFGSKPGLERIRALTRRLNDPQNKLKTIHVTGTNGKGSAAMFIASILRCAGYTIGLYTSPSIVRINETIQLNGEDISDMDLAVYVKRVKAVIDAMMQEGFEHPTQFEFLAALSFLYFYEKKCDAAVIEVGMGGRGDATNVIEAPVVSVITKITPDHIPLLGNSLADIAYEKAGIIKPGGNVVVNPQETTVMEVIKKTADSIGANVFCTDISEIEDIQIERGQLGFCHPMYGRLKTSVVGVHQVDNAAVALKTIEIMNKKGYIISHDHISEGFRSARWPGRFELLRVNPDFYIDGGHNPDGIRSLVKTFNRIYPNRKANIIFGVMKDKEYETMVYELSSIANRFIAITPDNSRALKKEELAEVMLRYCKNVELGVTIKEAVEKSLQSLAEDGIIIAAGSLYYIGQVRQIFVK